jgi:uncharacterized repeat protein (TIGR01451 family)
MKIVFALALLLAPVAAWAAPDVTITSAAFVERQVKEPSGAVRTVLEEPKVVTPGDRVVFVLNYKNGGSVAATGFVISNPLPTSVIYDGSDGEQPVVSVDGGKSWGSLATLKIALAEGGTRAATPADVTHLRWTFASIPAGKDGKLSFRGVVK